MITSNLYSMSVKELVTRLSVLLVVCAFAVSAKATLTIEPIPGEDKGYKITVNEPADLGPAAIGNSNNVFYTDEDGNEVKVSEVKELVIVTASGVSIGNGECENLATKFTSLNYLDLENCSINNVDKTLPQGANKNPLVNFNSSTSIKTLVFPNTDGMVIPTKTFENNTILETVIFPDRASSTGTYQIMSYAFLSSNVKTVSLGKGYSIPDMAATEGQYKSASGSGLSIFEHCKELKNVVFDNSITNLGERAFSATYNLEYVVLPEDLKHMGYLCFKESGIRTITIPDNMDLTEPDKRNGLQIFQGCIRLTNIYVNTDNLKAYNAVLMEPNQTYNFTWGAGDNPTYSQAGYNSTSTWSGSDYQADSPFNNKSYTVPVLHYPGTITAINNYRVPKYMHYSLVDPETGTTWPASNEINAYDPITVDGERYRAYSDDDVMSDYGGWRQFILGNNIFKEQRVFYDERIKESRWYSICLPINMTEAQFMNAYGVGAALHEFTGAEYDEESNMIVLKFDTPAQVEGGYLLKKNVPYMIHPAKIKFTKRKEVQIADLNGGVEFVKETVEGQEQYKTTEVIATFDVESDLFVRWDVLLAGGEAYAQAIVEVEENTTAALEENAQTRRFTNDKFPSVDYTFRGSYLGATIYGPADTGGKQKQMGTSPNLPVGAYYLGYQSGMSEPKFFKAKGTAVWSPYCALVEAADVAAGGGNGAKEFNVLSVDFNKSDVVVTKIGSPTIQIPVIKSDSKIYNLNGQVVRENSKDTSGLKGIYVVGGKKVIFN